MLTTPRRGHWCPSSWTVRLFDAVMSWICSLLLWTSRMRDTKSRAAKEHRNRSCPGRNHFVAELSRTCFEKSLIYQVLSFCLWRPEWCHTGIVKKKKTIATRALSLLPFLPLYKAIEYTCSFLSSKKEKKRTDRWSSSSGKTDTRAFLDKPLGLHVVSSIQVWKTFFSFDERNLRAHSKSHDSTNDGSTWRFPLVTRHATTLRDGGTPSWPRWGNFPAWRDFPFEWTNQSAFIFTGPQAQIPPSPYQQGLDLVRG